MKIDFKFAINQNFILELNIKPSQIFFKVLLLDPIVVSL